MAVQGFCPFTTLGFKFSAPFLSEFYILDTNPLMVFGLTLYFMVWNFGDQRVLVLIVNLLISLFGIYIFSILFKKSFPTLKLDTRSPLF